MIYRIIETLKSPEKKQKTRAHVLEFWRDAEPFKVDIVGVG